MTKEFDPEWGDATLGVRAGWTPGTEREHTTPIYATSSYVFDSAAQAAARFSGEEPGNIYSRFTNPTVQVFERRLAALEEGEACVATASGMAAILATCMSLLQCGDHIVSSRTLFGSSISLFENYLKPFGIEVTYVAPGDTQAWQAAVQDNTRMLFLETPSNPLTELADIRALANIAEAADALLVVDNCFCTPVLQKPLTMGAHVVVHSSTKYLDGQGRCIGGAVIGDATTVGEKVFSFIRTAGPSLSPFNAWVFLKALETLDLRVKAHCASARQLAEWLEAQDAIERVYYPGLASHPQHQLACEQQKDFGGIVSFDVKGGREAAWKLIDSTKMLSITANLGDTRTTITHPATTTHGRISPEARELAGIGEGLIRISVGLENIEDIIADLRAGLA
ncbi:MAG: O-succinylhomoserine sulfhydrylase [Salinisphaeraceae bacterium]|nr:O-succinylhomoserine sulfhydrylase [Salinisphaeraceae bacterium]